MGVTGGQKGVGVEVQAHILDENAVIEGSTVIVVSIVIIEVAKGLRGMIVMAGAVAVGVQEEGAQSEKEVKNGEQRLKCGTEKESRDKYE